METIRGACPKQCFCCKYHKMQEEGWFGKCEIVGVVVSPFHSCDEHRCKLEERE